MKFLIVFLGSALAYLIFAGLQRRFSSETVANGFMDKEKGKEIAPTFFEKESEKE